MLSVLGVAWTRVGAGQVLGDFHGEPPAFAEDKNGGEGGSECLMGDCLM